jgi:protein gp37
MAETTIGWTDHSINPIRARHKATGNVGHYCEKIASGCKFCYSSAMQRRFGTPEFGGGQLRDDFEIFLDPKKLEEVRRRRKPTKYFWCDMTDIFGDWMLPEWLDAIFETIDATQQHTHILLTKRPENIQRMWPIAGNGKDPGADDYARRDNVWLLCSIATQADADKDDPTIRRCIRFAADWGFGGIEMCNLYDWRATDPKNLPRKDFAVSEYNDPALRCRVVDAKCIIAAWGNVPWAKNGNDIPDSPSR